MALPHPKMSTSYARIQYLDYAVGTNLIPPILKRKEDFSAAVKDTRGKEKRFRAKEGLSITADFKDGRKRPQAKDRSSF